MTLTTKEFESLRKIADTQGCDNPDVVPWDSTGRLEIMGLVQTVRSMRRGGVSQILTDLGHRTLKSEIMRRRLVRA